MTIKDDIADFLKKTYFDQKLRNINKKVTWKKIRHVEVKNKIYDLLEKVELTSTKRLTKDLIDWGKIFHWRWITKFNISTNS